MTSFIHAPGVFRVGSCVKQKVRSDLLRWPGKHVDDPVGIPEGVEQFETAILPIALGEH